MSENYRSRTERKQVQKQKKEHNKPETKKKEKKTSFFRKFLIACLLIGIVGLVAGVSAFFIMIKDAPKLDKAKLINPLSTKFYDKDGNFIYEYGAEKRTNVTYDQIPKVVEGAFLATEDSRFYEHNGIDYKRTAKAVFENVTEGFGSQGGSTITQQVIKNHYLTRDKRVKRKVQEWYLAYKLEQEYSKQEILEMYLNQVNFGNRSYGIATAAKNYYNKDLKDLQLHEAAMLAGLPQSPNRYDPTKEENVQRATERRNTVLKLMNRHEYISKAEMEAAMQIPVTEGVQPPQELKEMPYQAFLDAAVKEIEAKLENVKIGTDGLQIYTTLDPAAQEYADKMLNTEEIINYPNEKFQGSFVFMDTKTGEVRALGSGRGEHKATFKGHNQALEMRKQIGSTMKPIYSFAPAIEYLKWSTYHQLDASQYKYKSGQVVSNAGRQYEGTMSMRKALEQSVNIPALHAANEVKKEVGEKKPQEFAETLGFSFAFEKDKQAVESTPLGTNSSSPTEVAGAYAAFGNDGVYNKPHFVKEVIFPDGKKVDFTPEEKRVMKDYTAFMITDMLRGALETGGTGTAANVPSLDVAGKTGTTNYSKEDLRKYNYNSGDVPDSWFAGYTPQYTMAVWTGYNSMADGSIKPNQTRIAQQMFKSMMTKFGTDKSNFKQPSSVERLNGELYIKGVKKDHVKKTEVEPPAGFNAAYDAASKTVNLSWSASSDKEVSYNLSYKSSDGESGSVPINGTSAKLGNIRPGITYTFSLTAKKGNGSSKAVTASVTVPGGEPPKEEEATDEDKEEQEQPSPPQPPADGQQSGGQGNGQQNGGQGNGQQGGGQGNGQQGGGQGNNQGGGQGNDQGGGQGNDQGGGQGNDQGGGGGTTTPTTPETGNNTTAE
ncbi:PBP1A family penicillin-binding protein [Bacillus manliponensis]|uniref:PBP1A family penicillin-binding protein n=1 Tax=Bacillus manliponensis TaxID=574376 RepID=UPI0039F138DE